MIDFWELTGRLLLMAPDVRRQEIYDTRTGILPIQSDGCILLGHADSSTLPFPVAGFYNQLRDYFAKKYPPGNLLAPVVSMFALGEIGVVFFNQNFRNAFEDLNTHLTKTSAIKGRTDTGSASLFYIALALLVVDKTTRESIADKADFLGLAPADQADRAVLQTLANDEIFKTKANTLCFLTDWTEGSANTLRDQTYGSIPGTPHPTKIIPFRHFRFVPNLP